MVFRSHSQATSSITSDPTIPFPGANAWVRAASLCHVNITPLLSCVGLEVNAQGEYQISRDGIIELMMLCTGQAAPTHHFPLVAGECFGFDTIPAIETFLATSPTLREAMPALEWISMLLTDVHMHLEEDDREARLMIDMVQQKDDHPKAKGYFVELIVACICKFSRMLLNGRPLAVRIEFMHDPGPVRSLCEMQYGIPLRINQPHNALVIPLAMLDQRLPGALPDMHRQLHGIIQKKLPSRHNSSLTERIEMLFSRDTQLMGQGIVKIAERLKLHPRTLQRRLKEEGQVYADIQTQCRYAFAVAQLKTTDKDIDTISEQLGFTDRNSFTRAFKQWTGLAPRDYRRIQRETAA